MKSNYALLSITDTEVLIEDLGPWDQYATVTNDAEAVVAELHKLGKLGPRRLFYLDSDGNRDEIRHDGAGRFLGFAAGETQTPIQARFNPIRRK